MGLFEFARAPFIAARIGGGFRQLRSALTKTGKAIAHFIDERVMINRACSGDDQRGCTIGAIHKAAHGLWILRANGFRRAENPASNRRACKSRFHHHIEYDFIGRIFISADFLQDHVFFTSKLCRIKCGIGENIGENINRQRHVRSERARVIGCIFCIGFSIHFAADGFDLFSNLQGIAARCAFKRHMFEKMREALLFAPLLLLTIYYGVHPGPILDACAGVSHSLAMDLHDQHVYMGKTGQWRFTPPTHVVVALHEAITQFVEEGGQSARLARYTDNYRTLVDGMAALGFEPFLKPEVQAPIIVTFHAPHDPAYDFKRFYEASKARGFILYPGKLTQVETFRVGCIGAIGRNEMQQAVNAVADTLKDMGIPSGKPLL